MPTTTFKKVAEVMHAHGVPIALVPTFPTEEEFAFRTKFLDEELTELKLAFEQENIVDMADAIADIVTVAMGLGAVMGLPMDLVLDAVNHANLTGKRLVTCASESKRNYEFDLVKTADFVSPEEAIAVILFGSAFAWRGCDC
jgi:predicted HAD superfamily Cof-like phosphohydrolase